MFSLQWTILLLLSLIRLGMVCAGSSPFNALSGHLIPIHDTNLYQDPKLAVLS